MDGFINTKIEAQTIYEIYRACRLCGAGAGYKMPIIQNVVDLDGTEVELKQKIRDCVQIEVHQDDKMPPLICELCVDKVNDFYEFFEMCRQTNKRTRLRLGLPPQTMPRGAPDAGDCILGITEPVFIAEEPLTKTRQTKNLKSNLKSSKNKNQETKVKIQLPSRRESKTKSKIEPRSLRSKQPSPPRLRGTKRVHEDDVALGSLQKSKRSAVPMPKSILKKTEIEDKSYLTPRLRGSKEKEREIVKKESSNKKVQILVKTSSSKTSQMKKRDDLYCKVCKIQYNNYRGYSNHMRVHANNKPPDRKLNRKSKEIECDSCEKVFPNKNILETHICLSVNCVTCGRKFNSRKALATHKSFCDNNRKKASVINPKWLRKVKPMQIRISRCDSLLEKSLNNHYDVSCVPFDYGLDKNCTYPYMLRTWRIKSEPGYMVSINDDIKEAFDADKYIHWDSEDTATESDDEDTKKVDSLSTIALKSIFSPKLLGKVPKKRRKVKAEKAFDSILNASDIDCDIRLGIDSIIDRLNDTIDSSKNKGSDNDSLFGDDKSQSVTNDDFDALFGDNDKVNDKSAVCNDDFDSLFGNDKNNDKSLESSDSVGGGANDDSEVNSDTKNNESVGSENDDGVKNDSDERISESGNNDAINDVSNDINKVDDAVSKEINEKESNDKIEESVEENKNIVQNNDSEKSNLDLNQLNETDSKQASDTDFNDKHITNDLNNDNNEVTNNDTTVEDKINETDKKDSPQPDILKTKENDSDIKDVTDYKNDIETSKSTDKIEKMETDEYVNGESLEDKFNMEDLEDVSDSEMDDKILMDELDAQIGEEKRVV